MSVESAKEWLRRAELDLDLAMVCETNDPAMSCHMSQQSIETAIKAAIVFENIPIPYIHNIGRLGCVPQGYIPKNV